MDQSSIQAKFKQAMMEAKDKHLPEDKRERVKIEVINDKKEF